MAAASSATVRVARIVPLHAAQHRHAWLAPGPCSPRRSPGALRRVAARSAAGRPQGQRRPAPWWRRGPAVQPAHWAGRRRAGTVYRPVRPLPARQAGAERRCGWRQRQQDPQSSRYYPKTANDMGRCAGGRARREAEVPWVFPGQPGVRCSPWPFWGARGFPCPDGLRRSRGACQVYPFLPIRRAGAGSHHWPTWWISRSRRPENCTGKGRDDRVKQTRAG